MEVWYVADTQGAAPDGVGSRLSMVAGICRMWRGFQVARHSSNHSSVSGDFQSTLKTVITGGMGKHESFGTGLMKKLGWMPG